MNIVVVAAITYAVITTGVVLFQLALALGAPWGSLAMGGAFPGRFPAKMRVAAVAQAVLLALMAAAVLSRAGLILSDWSQVAMWLTWGVVAFTAVSVVLNLSSPSPGERRIWVPVALVLFVCSLTVGLGPEIVTGSEQSSTAGSLEETEWVLTRANEPAINAADAQISITFADGQAAGSGGINQYSGQYETGPGGALDIGPIAATKIGGPAPLMEAEVAYFQLLEDTASYSIHAETLTFYNWAGSEILVFESSD
jgi:heat shock protein HslJ